ncbi:hypothetical protein DMH17_12200 [Raoultella planticola]|nr:hypothetical protein [Raoultella planticola]
MLYINAEAVHSLRAEAAREFAGDRPVFPGLFDELHPAPVLTGVLEGAARARQTDRYSSAFATCWLN